MDQNAPEVTELMERIREEARGYRLQKGAALPPKVAFDLPPLTEPLPPLPPISAVRAGGSERWPWAALGEMVARARRKITVRGGVPAWLRPLFRNQGGFNGILLEALERVGQANQELQAQVDGLKAQSAWLQTVARTRAADREWMLASSSCLERLVEHSNGEHRRIDRLEARLSQFDAQHASTRGELDQLGLRAGYIETHANGLGEHVNRLQTHADEQGGRFLEVTAQVDRSRDQLIDLWRATDSQGASFTHLREHFESLQAQLDTVRGPLSDLQQRLADQSGQSEAVKAQLSSLQAHVDKPPLHEDAVKAHLGNLSADVDSQNAQSEAVRAHLSSLQAYVDHQNAHNDTVDHHLGNLQGFVENQVARDREFEAQFGKHIEHSAASRAELAAATRQLDDRQAIDATFLKSQLNLVTRLLQRSLGADGADGAGERPLSPPASGNSAALQEYAAHDLDAFYLAFENAFRGGRESVQERLRVHLGPLAAAGVGAAERPLLDLGCGRGEWLEVLREAGHTAAGIDLNDSMIEQCRERGLEVIQANALDYLRAEPEASRGAITAFHLIEHLPFRVLFELVHECHRVLQPGGVLIFETPNPTNIVVGASEFWGDYTHQRPLPPGSASFLVANTGFIDVRIVPLHPVPDETSTDPGPEAVLLKRVHSLIYSARDYALVAVKA